MEYSPGEKAGACDADGWTWSISVYLRPSAVASGSPFIELTLMMKDRRQLAFGVEPQLLKAAAGGNLTATLKCIHKACG
jgi:hypothetical protein